MRQSSCALVLTLLAIMPLQANAETLPLPEDLIALQSAEGEALLFGAEARRDYLPLSIHFTTQRIPTFCGPATIAMLLNALEVPRPPSDATSGRGLFDQENVFTRRVEALKSRGRVARGGMSLKEFGAALAAHDLEVDVHHASDTSLDEFRRIAAAELESDGRFVAVNYRRSELEQEIGGHISPLAAYDADTDRFLVLDVARYKYPPVWVEAAALYDAMNTTAGKKTRGFVVVGRGTGDPRPARPSS